MDYRARLTTPKGAGIGVAIVVLVIIVVIVIAAVGAYYVLSPSSPSTPGPSSTTSHSSTRTSTSTVVLTTTSSTRLATSGSTDLTYYSGSFNYSIPVGPSGVRSLPNGTAQYYNSVQVASGTFTFFVAAGNYSGSGTGHGTYTVTTTGFCTGSETFPYNFTIPDVTTLLGDNLTVFFSNPVPANYSVSLTCTGDMTGVSTATNDPGPYLPVYPNEITIPLASLPASGVFHGTPSATFVWGYSLKETGTSG